MNSNDVNKSGLSRRDLLSNAAAATGALVVGFWMPQRAPAQIINPQGATWAVEPAVKEINAWVVVAPDETVTIRIAQTELGQGVWTSNAMMVAEELQCDWTKVRPQYASVNRDGRGPLSRAGRSPQCATTSRPLPHGALPRAGRPPRRAISSRS